MITQNVTRTIYAAHLQTSKLLGRPFTVLPNSTLNQKFNLFDTEPVATNEYPVLKYIAIGNKGAKYEVTADNFVLTTPIPHLPRHASLYNFLPFLIRPLNDDISSTERLNYRMRVPMTINGDSYVAYYLKVLPTDSLNPSVELRNVNDGVVSAVDFTPDVSDLSPAQVDLANFDLNNPNGDYLVSTAKMDFVLGLDDVTNIIDACELLYGDARYAVINEIALCTGVDRVLNGTGSPSSVSYTESIATQIAAFFYHYHAITSSTTEVRLQLDIGSVEPLLV